MSAESKGLIDRIRVILITYETERVKLNLKEYTKAEQALCAIKQEIEGLCPHGDYFYHCNESGEQFDDPCTLAHMHDSEECCAERIDDDDYHCPYCYSINIECYDLATLNKGFWRCFDCNREFKEPHKGAKSQ